MNHLVIYIYRSIHTSRKSGLVAIESAPADSRVPVTYYWWLFGVIWTLTGMAILAFGLAWIATGISGAAAALVLSSGVLTRLVLSIPGGIVGRPLRRLANDGRGRLRHGSF